MRSVRDMEGLLSFLSGFYKCSLVSIDFQEVVNLPETGAGTFPLAR